MDQSGRKRDGRGNPQEVDGEETTRQAGDSTRPDRLTLEELRALRKALNNAPYLIPSYLVHCQDVEKLERAVDELIAGRERPLRASDEDIERIHRTGRINP